MFGQAVVRVTGRVVDDDGKPVAGADVRVSTATSFLASNVLTDRDGTFSIDSSETPNKPQFLFVSDSKYWPVRCGLDLAENPPYLRLRMYDRRFRGLPIKFSGGTALDVGDVKVQNWFAPVEVKIDERGKSLSEDKWLKLWLRYRDLRGHVLMERSIAPTIEKSEIDVERSTIKICLPEGSWIIDLLTYDYDTNKIGTRPIGRSGTIVIRRDKTAEAKISLNGDFPI